MACNYKALVQTFEKAGTAKATQWLKESFEAKAVRPHEIDLGRLFEECFGSSVFRECRAKERLARDVFTEAAGAVSTAAFQSISGQLVISATLDAYTNPDYIFTRLIPTVPTVLSGERIPGISGIGDEALVVPEGKPYPLAGVTESYIDTPPTQKRGMIVPVTREAIFFDRTGVLLERCRQVGDWLAVNKEKRAIDAVIDENAGAVSAMIGGHRYHFKGNSIASYGNSSGTHDWDNLSATTTLVDWTDIEACEVLLENMADPDTGEVTGNYRAAAKHIVVAGQNYHTAKQIMTATSLVMHAGGYATTGNLPDRVSPNSLQSYEIITSPLLAARLAVDTHWFLGNVSKAVRYMENWPISVKEAPTNSHEEFHQDIVSQYRADERGAYAVFDPRYLICATVA